MIAHPPLRAFAAAVLELGALMEQVDAAQWRQGYAPARREDTTERSKGGHSDPVAFTVAEPRRLALRAAVQAGDREIALATARIEATAATLRRATEAWSGEPVAPLPFEPVEEIPEPEPAP